MLLLSKPRSKFVEFGFRLYLAFAMWIYVTYPRVWAGEGQSWGHQRWGQWGQGEGRGGCSSHCTASCMPRLIRARIGVNVSLLMLNFILCSLYLSDVSPFTSNKSMSQGMVKLTASEAVSKIFSPWMLMEIKLSRKKSYKKAQHC